MSIAQGLFLFPSLFTLGAQELPGLGETICQSISGNSDEIPLFLSPY